jgi:hypothetical protein
LDFDLKVSGWGSAGTTLSVVHQVLGGETQTFPISVQLTQWAGRVHLPALTD